MGSARNIFHDTSIKLTAIYLSIIMFISLVFSIGLYRVSSSEIERSVRTHGPVEQILRTRNTGLIADLIEEQNELIGEAKDRIRGSLILINMFILVGGGILSYYLAKRTLKPIEEAHEAQSRFTADASHELRTPITAMRIENELALSDEELTLKKAKQQLLSNIEELDKLTELSEGLLQLARLGNNGLEMDTVSVAHIVSQAVEHIQIRATSKKITLKTEDIVDTKIRANQPAIVQVVTILLDNAVKYSQPESTVTISSKKLKHTVEISVKDSGSGIRPSELPHIFERFYRADSSRAKNDVHGYGIGLSIAKAIIELHGGKIIAKSLLNKGSTFTITLPII